MPALYLDDATYKKFLRFKREIVSMDVQACRDKEDTNDVSLFWTDDMTTSFILDVMSDRLFEEKIKYRFGRYEDQLESLR